MRKTEKVSEILILALIGWALIMLLATNLQFEGKGSQRILRVELGSDAASLNQAVAGKDGNDTSGVAHNIELVKRNTYVGGM